MMRAEVQGGTLISKELEGFAQNLMSPNCCTCSGRRVDGSSSRECWDILFKIPVGEWHTAIELQSGLNFQYK